MPTLDPPAAARAVADRPGVCFLDTAAVSPDGAGTSLLFAEPLAVFTSRNGSGRLRWRDGRTERLDGDPFRRVAERLAAPPSAAREWIAAGYWAYDLKEGIPEATPPAHRARPPRRMPRDDLRLPHCWIGFYDSCLRFPAPGGAAGEPAAQPEGTRWPADAPPIRPAALPPGIHADFSREAYEAAVRRILEYIAAGDCYQVNLSQRFCAPWPHSPWRLYERLRRFSPAPFAAYLNCGDHQILSASPECFLRIADGEVETRPIKGTRPRGATPDEDAARAAELLASAKDRAELVMIVDLERNDLGRVCEYGSVHVPELCRLESYASVHHLVATVRGRLRSGLGPLDALRAAFPGGSITGAPKIRAMEIIDELEPVRRHVYTGAIGWVDARGRAEWSIAIRTMTLARGRVRFSAGGGIVADSDPSAEYDETLAKAHGMLRACGWRGGEG